jgi:hypothetical protein
LFFLLRLFVQNAEHLSLKSLFVLVESVLLPGEIKNFAVQIVAGEACFKPPDTLLVVRLLFKLERTAMFHVLFEF